MSFKQKWKKSFVFALLLVILLLFLLLLSVLLLYFRTIEYSNKPYQFEHYNFNPFTNKSSHGLLISKTPLQFPQNNFIAYEDQFGSQILISPSPFHQNIYNCKGSCFCNDENVENSRRYTYSLSRGLVHLVAAISTVAAVSISKQFFHEECLNNFDGFCNSIESEVDGCYFFENDNDDDDSDKVFRTHLGEVRKFEEKIKIEKFFCGGNCYFVYQKGFLEDLYLNGYISEGVMETYRLNYDLIEDHGMKYNCKSMRYENEIEGDVKSEWYEDGNVALQIFEIRKTFIKKYLTPFCLSRATEEIYVPNSNGEDVMTTFSFCSGVDEFGVNSNALCTPVIPRQT